MPAQRDTQAEALVALAITAGFGVFAIPGELRMLFRVALGVATSALVLFLFARFPRLAASIVGFVLRAGLWLVVPIFAVVGAFLFAPLVSQLPTIEMTPATATTLQAVGLGALGAILFDLMTVLQAMRHAPRSRPRLLIGTAIAAVLGAAGAFIVSPSGVYQSLAAPILVGMGSLALIQTIVKGHRDLTMMRSASLSATREN